MIRDDDQPTCQDLAAFLADYVAGTLPDATRADFERHVAACPPCTAYLRSYRATIELTRATAPPDPADMPPELVDAIVRARPPRR